MNGTRAERTVASLYGLGGAVATLGVGALYLTAIAQQGVTPPGGRVTFVAAWLGAVGVVGLTGSLIRRPAARAAVLGAAAAMAFALAIPAMFSFGAALLGCAILLAVGAFRAAERSAVPTWVGILAPLAFVTAAGLGVAIGFALTTFGSP